jgi:hypothetical protein
MDIITSHLWKGGTWVVPFTHSIQFALIKQWCACSLLFQNSATHGPQSHRWSARLEVPLHFLMCNLMKITKKTDYGQYIIQSPPSCKSYICHWYNCMFLFCIKNYLAWKTPIVLYLYSLRYILLYTTFIKVNSRFRILAKCLREIITLTWKSITE